ncbi:MAG: hypothetical protein FJ314_06310 [SAR202 cluster bacterium]|nr:hypothetical protein [SAR202 cluster bacterium]
MSSEMVVLRILHIVPGAFWVGTAIFMALILEPVARKAGPQIEGPLVSALWRRTGHIMTATGALTIIIGLVLIDRTPGKGYDQLFANGWGIAIGIGLVTSLIALVAGLMIEVAAASMNKLAAGSKPGTPPAPETMASMEKLKTRLRTVSRVNAVMVVVAVGTMAAARFV